MHLPSISEDHMKTCHAVVTRFLLNMQVPQNNSSAVKNSASVHAAFIPKITKLIRNTVQCHVFVMHHTKNSELAKKKNEAIVKMQPSGR
jgi:hypothetical protein